MRKHGGSPATPVNLAKVKFVPVNDALVAAGQGSVRISAENFYGPFSVLESVSLSSLRTALIKAATHYEIDQSQYQSDTPHTKSRIGVDWYTGDEADFDLDYIFSEAGTLVLNDEDELLIRVDLKVAGRDPFDPYPELAEVLSAWSLNRGVHLVSLEGYLSIIDLWAAYFSIPLRGRSLREAHDFARDAEQIGNAYVGGSFSAELISIVLESGQAGALIGLPESRYLECKRHLAFEQERVQIDFARDIAAFANGGDGGLIAIGVETKNRGGDDIVVALHPIRDASKLARRARRAVDRLVFPPIEGLVIKSVTVGNHDQIIYCLIPRQEPELKPFMVAGAFIDGKLEGSIISVPRRRDDETLHLSPASLHSFIAAGYALFRGARPESRPISRQDSADDPPA